MKFFVLSIALIGLFASCKKSSSTPSTTLTATLNGTNKNFGVSATGIKVVQSGITGYAAIGTVSLGGEEIDISIDNSISGDSIVPGTYSDTSSRFDIDLQYNVNSTGGDSYEGGSEIDGSLSGVPGLTNHLKLVITSVSSTRISGTFSGNMYLNGDPSSTVIAVTNGNFNVPVHQ